MRGLALTWPVIMLRVGMEAPTQRSASVRRTAPRAAATMSVTLLLSAGALFGCARGQETKTPLTPAAGSSLRQSRGEKEKAVAEALIRQRIESYAKAIVAKDIDGVMSFFAPNVVSFDLAPPLRYFGADNKRRRWQEDFALHRSIAYEVRDLTVTTHGDVAFVHAVNHFTGTLANGQVNDAWVRWTACFQRIEGAWLIVHDHVSVPTDLEHGRAVLNLTP
jgi:ketosteroid isomerase-like protein